MLNTIFLACICVMTIGYSVNIYNVLYYDKSMTMYLLPFGIITILTANRIFGKNRGVLAVEKWDPRATSGEPLCRAVLCAVRKILTPSETVCKGGVLKSQKMGLAETRILSQWWCRFTRMV